MGDLKKSQMSSVCTSLACRINPSNKTCTVSPSVAVDGTTCDIGKVNLNLMIKYQFRCNE